MNVMSTTLDQEQLAWIVETVLRRLRISGKLKGLWYLNYAVIETVKDPFRTMLITKDLYPEIAKAHRTTIPRVERAIRTAVQSCWDNGRNELDQMAGYHLVKRPSNTEFIDLVAAYIRHS